MKTFLIKRNYTGREGTFGTIQLKGKPPFALTLEPQWLDNQKNISCIPAGDYPLFPVDSPRFGKTWEIAEVPDRTHILFHPLNTADQSRGCIGVGEKFGFLKDEAAILSSRQGYVELKDKLKGLSYARLEITEHF